MTLLEVIFELLAYFFDRGRKKPSSPKTLSFKERLARARVRKRNRALRGYLKKRDPRRPIPNAGLTCPNCGYSLTGLREHRCPECGRPFDLQTMIDHNAGFGLRRRKSREG